MTEVKASVATLGSSKTVAQVLGEVAWLMSQSPLHRQMFIGDLEWFCMPPILLEQFRVFNGAQGPVAVAFWAFVSEETEKRLSHGAQKLRTDEWKNGDRVWLVDLVAPFGGQDEILRDLSANVFNGRAFSFSLVGPDGTRRVVTYDPQGAGAPH